LVLAEVGRSANVQITDEELTRALIERARAYPGQEQEIWNYYRNNQGALAELRAPIFEEKAVDHVLGLAKVEDRKVTPEELMKADEEENAAASS
jgi:trigger factor